MPFYRLLQFYISDHSVLQSKLFFRLHQLSCVFFSECIKLSYFIYLRVYRNFPGSVMLFLLIFGNFSNKVSFSVLKCSFKNSKRVVRIFYRTRYFSSCFWVIRNVKFCATYNGNFFKKVFKLRCLQLSKLSAKYPQCHLGLLGLHLFLDVRFF